MSAKTQTFVNHSSAQMGKPQSLLVLVHHWRGPAVVGREHTGARREDVSPCSPHGGVGGGKGSCRSGCLVHSTGYKDITRTCMVLEGYEGETCTGQDR